MNKTKGFIKLTVFALICLSLISRHAYNEFVDEEHFLNIAHDRLEAEMQQRHDLITGCWDAVKKYKDIEEKIHNHLIKLHGLTKSKGNYAAKLKEEHELIELIRQLDILKEQYPALKSKDPYVHLMDTIKESGWRVTVERFNYNKKAYEYNIMCSIFPYWVLARIYGFDKKPFFEMSEKTQSV